MIAVALALALTPQTAQSQVDVVEHLGEHIPLALSFYDQDNQPVTLDSYFSANGKPVVVILAYYQCPMLCGLVVRQTANAMRDVGLELGHDFHALTVSIDPRDHAPAARRAEENALASAGRAASDRTAWPFLVGPVESSRALADALGFRYAWDERTQQFAHPAVVFVLSGDGRIMRYLYGVGAEDTRQLRLALLEAGQGKIGSTVDRVLLACFHWDPATRRYGLFVVGFLRIGAAIILLLVAGMLTFLFLLERRRSRSQAA